MSNPFTAVPDNSAMKHTLADDGAAPPQKKQRSGSVKRHHLKHHQPGALLALAHPQDPNVVEQQLDRGLSVALHLAGFHAIKNDAFESLRGLVDQYMTRFSSQVAHSMDAARRTQPEPADFERAWRAFGLRLDSMDPDLELAPASSVTQPALLRADPAESSFHLFETPATILVSKTFGNGEKEKRQSRWVPKQLPQFPPMHTYKATPVVPERETDARKMRERATEEGVLAEKALRKLVAARKPSQMRETEPRSSDLGTSNEDAFRDAMQETLKAERGSTGLLQEDAMLLLDGANDAPPPPPEGTVEEDLGMSAIVNWDQSHWRQRAARNLLGAS